jgi:hypothetical protein
MYPEYQTSRFPPPEGREGKVRGQRYAMTNYEEINLSTFLLQPFDSRR